MKDSKGRGAEIQVRAQFLGGTGSMPDHADGSDKRSTIGRWRSHDLQRAIAAARKAGLARYRVEIAPDGTIAIIVGLDHARRRGRRGVRPVAAG